MGTLHKRITTLEQRLYSKEASHALPPVLIHFVEPCISDDGLIRPGPTVKNAIMLDGGAVEWLEVD